MEFNKFNIEIIVFVVFVIGYYFVQRMNDLKLTLQYLLYSYGIAILSLTITIPNVFQGYPFVISDLENKKTLLYHLQKNNDALADSIDTMKQIAFLTFSFLTAIISKIIKHYKLEDSPK